jgi:hypothetical protein
MFIPNTADDFAFAYIEARKAKVSIDQMGTVERAGYHLLSSAAGSLDGEMCPQHALVSALKVGEVEAAMVLFEGLMASHDDVPLTGDGNPCRMISGSFEAR